MAFFISYSRRDTAEVRILAADLQRTRHDVWLDEELGGGEQWWQEILDRIRRCEVFVLALSDHSMASRPCRAELDYAVALGVPVLPVQVGDVGSLRTLPVAERQIVDLRERVRAGRSAVVDTGIALAVAALDLSAKRAELPDPLPPAPPIPFEYLMQLRIALDAPELDSRLQLQVLTQLKQALRDEEDPPARRDLVELLRRLRAHPDVTYRNAQEIDDILRADRISDDDDRSPETVVVTRTSLASPRPEPESPTSAEPPVQEPVPDPSVASDKEHDAAPARSDGLSVIAAVLGGIGLGQFAPLLSYLAFPGHSRYLLGAAPFVVVTSWALVLAMAGAGFAVAAIRSGERRGRALLVVAVLGVIITANLLLAQYRLT